MFVCLFFQNKVVSYTSPQALHSGSQIIPTLGDWAEGLTPVYSQCGLHNNKQEVGCGSAYLGPSPWEAVVVAHSESGANLRHETLSPTTKGNPTS